MKLGIRSRGVRLGVAGVAAAVAATLISVQPAYAGNAVPQWDTGDPNTATVVTFVGPRRELDSNGLHGDAALTIDQFGRWTMVGHAKNNRPAFRNVHFTCSLTLEAPRDMVNPWVVKIGSQRIKRHSSRTYTIDGHEPFLANNFREIALFAEVDCNAKQG
jgi:hypothetical protein